MGAAKRALMPHALAAPQLPSRLYAVALALLAGCSRERPAEAGSHTITLGAYTTPREAYGEAIVPAFVAQRRAQGAPDTTVHESYLGSGAQARAIVGGFGADVAALSLEPDIEVLRAAGLIQHDWRAGEHGGMVTRSVVVIGVRRGNPKNIRSWEDLARPGVEVLTPNVRTSGGAMWNVLAIYGAAIRGRAGTPAGDHQAAVGLLASILRNVKNMDRSARDSLLTFERGVGDAIITYENEILVGRAHGRDYEYVTPPSTILIENPVALVDVNVDRHGSRELARSFVDFLYSVEAQRAFAQHGLRPVVASVAAETSAQFAAVDDLFTIGDLGGWASAQTLLFQERGVYDQALARDREGSR